MDSNALDAPRHPVLAMCAHIEIGDPMKSIATSIAAIPKGYANNKGKFGYGEREDEKV